MELCWLCAGHVSARPSQCLGILYEMADVIQSQQFQGCWLPRGGQVEDGGTFQLKVISASSLGLVDIRECKQDLSPRDPASVSQGHTACLISIPASAGCRLLRFF